MEITAAQLGWIMGYMMLSGWRLAIRRS